MTGTKAHPLSPHTSGASEGLDPARVRFIAALVVVVSGSFSALGAFASKPVGPVAYVGALAASTLVLALVAKEHRHLARAWWLIAGGSMIWFVAGLLVTLQASYNVTAIPGIVVSLAYTLGYLPVLVGFAELADPQLHTRRVSSILDGVILFLALYAVLWLLVVEQTVYNSSYGLVDRAFQSLYPAGDLAIIMLTIRVLASRSVRRHVGLLLLAGAVLNAFADVGLLVFYLVKPQGSSPPVYDLSYLVGAGAFALAGVLALLPGPPLVAAGAKAGTRLPLAVAVSALLPAVLLAGIQWFTDRTVSVAPIAVWLFLVALASVLRNFAGMRELERAHQHALWLASHDLDTDMLRRATFLHEVSEGSLRDRSGTVIIVEVGGLAPLADRRGHDAVDHVVDVVAARLDAGAGDGAVLARMAHDQFAIFLRSVTLGRGRQVAGGLQTMLIEPVPYGDELVQLELAIGVAQADGAVIDVLAGVRRATEAMRHARRLGPGHLAVDADLTGTVLAASAQASAHQRPGAAAPTLG